MQTPRAVAFLIALLVGGCTDRVEYPVVARAGPELVPARTSDSLIALCLPREFARRASGRAWSRGEPAAPGYAFFSLAVLDSSEIATWSEWPPVLHPDSSGPLHSFICNDISVDEMTIAGAPARVQSGRCGGGSGGFSNTPVLTAGWPLRDGRLGFVLAWSDDPRDIASFLEVIPSIRIAPLSPRDAP